MIHSRFPRLLLVIAALLVSGAAFSTPVAAVFPNYDYILCSCDFCRVNPTVECQISPSGYSILCSDYSHLHNCKP